MPNLKVKKIDESWAHFLVQGMQKHELKKKNVNNVNNQNNYNIYNNYKNQNNQNNQNNENNDNNQNNYNNCDFTRMVKDFF